MWKPWCIRVDDSTRGGLPCNYADFSSVARVNLLLFIVLFDFLALVANVSQVALTFRIGWYWSKTGVKSRLGF